MSFTRFPELPAELRLHIWEAALPSRITTIVGTSYEQLADGSINYDNIGIQSNLNNVTLNAMYRACKDAHDTVKRAGYKLCFRERLGGRAIPFNKDTDVLDFSQPEALQLFRNRGSMNPWEDFELEQVKHLASPCPFVRVNKWDIEMAQSESDMIDLIFTDFTRMKSLMLLSHESFNKRETCQLLAHCRGKVYFEQAYYRHRVLNPKIKIEIVDAARYLEDAA
ncbi:uncharacterized protein PAC_01107 [Phialocephala subalpina]|uniref:2EXR domain-containing protein n=1 Tax=Phialocephala subalpina TaxID=576137 RepID=A0A1L7WEM5_9HELO|nr:uncharacterized protein PAC_01107 [Phialocephala subalpina]